ncbi:MAG: hypothetical protein ABI321_17390 [Polyangia bacterium]
MPIVIRELHRAPNKDHLNEEWFVLENTGTQPVSAKGYSVTVSRSANNHPRILGTLDPGFLLKSGEKIRIVTGTASRKAEGTPPAESDTLKNYHLFLKESVITGPGAIVRLALKQLELTRGTFKPDAPNGVA